MDSISPAPIARHTVVFGVYRDGDNNLDAAQERNVTDFIGETAKNRSLKVVAEDTTALPRAPFMAGDLRTEDSIIEDGVQHVVRVTAPVDMSDRAQLATFVERMLSAKAADSKFAAAPVWIDLVDHGGGDGGAIQSDSSGGFMSVEDIAGAIADGRERFLSAHPGADGAIAGVVANQCLMASLGFADALSRAGVRYLCASPETMLAPGVPSAKIADDLTKSTDRWPNSVVGDTMRARYGSEANEYHPAAAFDVIDLDPAKMGAVRTAVRDFNEAVVHFAHEDSSSEAIRDLRADLKSVHGMVRFDRGARMPWHADRPAIAAYGRIAGDERLPGEVRAAARRAAEAVENIVLAHRESKAFGPFHASYADAEGPTSHLPTSRQSYDSWADAGVSETQTAFYDAVEGAEFAGAIGAYNAAQASAGDSA